MPYIIIVIVISIFIVLYCFFVILYRLKLNKLEDLLKKDFKKRNYKVVSLYYISENFLNKHKEIFSEYINLKEKDFYENTLNFEFENKLSTYKKLHNEINFIFKLCEMNQKISVDKRYNYIKEEILKESYKIWEKYELYKKIIIKYRLHHKISKFFLVWFFLR